MDHDSARRAIEEMNALVRLSGGQVSAVCDDVHSTDKVVEQPQFVGVGLQEPPEPDVRAFRLVDETDRRVRALILGRATGEGRKSTASHCTADSGDCS